MSLPTSRNRTYSAATQVASADLNDLQDSVIADWTDGPHGDRHMILHATEFPVATWPDTLGRIYEGVLGGFWESTDSVQSRRLWPRLRAGDRIKQISWSYYNAANPGTAKTFEVFPWIHATASYGYVADWASFTHLGGPSADAIAVQVGATPFVVAAGEAPALVYRTSGISDRLYSVDILYDHPF